MKRIVRLRAAIAALNVLLVALVVLGARSVFLVRQDPHLPVLPVKEIAIETRGRERLDPYSVIWKEIDRVPPPPEPAREPVAVPPTPDALLRLALVAEFHGPGLERFCILQRVGAAEQLVLRAGETQSGFTCESIERDGADFVAVVKGATGTGRLRVRREQAPTR